MRNFVLSLALLLAGQQPHGSPPLVVGDSIGVRTFCPGNAYACIGSARGMTVNALVGRSFQSGIQIASGYRIPPRVAIELGTNGPISMADVDAMMSVLRPARRVVFVTCYVARGGWSLAWQWCGRGFTYGVNAVLLAARRQYAKVRLARWDLVAAPYLVDGVHPDYAGCQKLFSLIHRALYAR